MKLIVIVLLAALAGTMAWFALRGDCPGGTIYATEAACRAAGTFPEAFCRKGFMEANRAAGEATNTFSTQAECQQHYARCEQRSRALGQYVPMPTGACLAEGKPGQPVFERLSVVSNPRGQ
jgi:uncharacterized protein YgiB involved in biofilm formation